MLLEVENLTVRYGKSAAVDCVTFQLQAGEALGLIGESGCGKTTIGRSLIKLLPESAALEGRITIDGEEIATKKDGRWRGENVGLIFQDPMTRLNPLMSIEAHALEVIHSHYPTLSNQAAKFKIQEAFKSVNIDPQRVKQYPHEFSGGMRQRVAIALSLLLNPALLIADEPTTSLDVTVASEILQELTELRRNNGMGLLLITHDLGMVAAYCDRIAVMYQGAIVETGTVQEIFTQPQHPYTQALLKSVLHFQPQSIAQESPQPENQLAAPVILSVQQLHKRYITGSNLIARLFNPQSGVIKAIDDVNLEIYAEETFGIIGESGSGKSTTGRAILQLVKPDRGSVKFNGVELTQLNRHQLRLQRSQMQMIFQDPRACFSPHMQIFRSIADPLLIHKLAPNLEATRSRVNQLLERVGLDPQLAERYPADLSGGQLQRVAIARALITNPKLVICDEPVSMLDASIQSQVLQLMRDLKAEFQLTYIFITHDLAVAQFFCDRLAVMHQGKIVEQGSTHDVLTNPQHEYTQSLIASVPRIPQVDR
ncbi:MAG: ABC transporter ATP-binding protein [Pseudanabaenaceae cyanobacterium bins.39]|nr:ABC transporter ATP-binding protein [Pseudanabaenaceae cyanobacterium bins.39]